MKETRYNSSMKWPYNFIYAVTHEKLSEVSDNIKGIIENILNYCNNRTCDILWRRFHNYEMCKDIADSYNVTNSRISMIIRESCTELDSIYHDNLISGIMPDEIKLTEDSDIHDVMGFGLLDARTYNCIIRHFCGYEHDCTMNRVKIKDVVALYNEKYRYKFANIAKSNGLMHIRHMGKVSYDNITRILKEYGFINGEIDKFKSY